MSAETPRHQPPDEQWKARAERERGPHSILARRLSRSLPPLSRLQTLHDSVFETQDCLACANCCRTSSPTFTRTDIRRIAGFLGMREADFEKTYLHADADGDYIPRTRPCPMLGEDNRCRVYDVRPRSCRGYPHTDEKQGWERSTVLAGNARVCPAVFRMLEIVRTWNG
jgi:Fe-S-cluster containining protein